MARILVADDQPDLAELIRTVLEGDGYAVEAVHSGQDALERLALRAYDLVICDLQMPDVDGAVVSRAVEQLAPPRPAVLFMTGYGDTSTYGEFLQTTGAVALSKPIGIDALRAAVRQQLSRCDPMRDRRQWQNLEGWTRRKIALHHPSPSLRARPAVRRRVLLLRPSPVEHALRGALRSRALRQVLVGMLLAGILQGCSISPAEQDTIRRAWEERDAERTRECRQVGGFLIAGSCLPRP